jgi:hypothetical protein
MSSSASDPGKGTPSLAARIDALERETAALTAALALAQRVRFGITLLLVAFVGLTITVFYQRAKELGKQPYLDELRKVAEEKLEPRQKDLMREAKTLLDTAGPKFKDAFLDQASKDLPKYLQAAGMQRDALVNNLQDRLQAKVGKRFEDSMAKQEELLKAEFPQAENEKLHARMMDNVQLGLQRVAKKYYGDQLKQQVLELYGTWDLFPTAELPTGGQDSLENQLIGSLLELAVIKLKNTEKFVETP